MIASRVSLLIRRMKGPGERPNGIVFPYPLLSIKKSPTSLGEMGEEENYPAAFFFLVRRMMRQATQAISPIPASQGKRTMLK